MSKFRFDRVLSNLNKMMNELPTILANDVQNYALDNFRNQGIDGKPWKNVQRRISGTPEWKYPKTKGLSRRTKPININTGRLRRAVSRLASNSKASRSRGGFRLVLKINKSVVPYAGYINDGTDNMVARPFMDQNSAVLNRIIRNRVNNYIDRLWRG